MVNLKGTQPARRILWAGLAVALVAAMVFAPLMAVSAEEDWQMGEYAQYVHTYITSEGENMTKTDKPGFPIFLNESQVAIGCSWKIVEPLVANLPQCSAFSTLTSTLAFLTSSLPRQAS